MGQQAPVHNLKTLLPPSLTLPVRIFVLMIVAIWNMRREQVCLRGEKELFFWKLVTSLSLWNMRQKMYLWEERNALFLKKVFKSLHYKILYYDVGCLPGTEKKHAPEGGLLESREKNYFLKIPSFTLILEVLIWTSKGHFKARAGRIQVQRFLR